MLLNRNGESEGWEFNLKNSQFLLLDTRFVTASSVLCFSMTVLPTLFHCWIYLNIHCMYTTMGRKICTILKLNVSKKKKKTLYTHNIFFILMSSTPQNLPVASSFAAPTICLPRALLPLQPSYRLLSFSWKARASLRH